VSLSEGAAALLCCPEDRLDAETIMALPDTVQVIATFSVGYDHVAVEAAGLGFYDGEPIVNPGYLGLQNVVLFAASRQRHGGDPRRYGLQPGRFEIGAHPGNVAAHIGVVRERPARAHHSGDFLIRRSGYTEVDRWQRGALRRSSLPRFPAPASRPRHAC